MDLRRRILAGSVSVVAMTVAAAGPALAADAPAATASEVVVTGIRESLERAIEIKKSSDDQVDAMSQALARLLLDGTGANAWLAWAKRKAEEATGHVAPATPAVAGESPKPAGQPTLTAAGLVTPTDHPDTWLVRFSDGRRDYAVTPDGACTCQAGAHGRPCRHVTAAQLASQGAGTAIPPAVVEQIDPVAARKRARDAAFRAMR